MTKKIAHDIMKAYDFDAFSDNVFMQYKNKLNDTNYHLEFNVFSEDWLNGSIEFYKKNNFFKKNRNLKTGWATFKNGCTILKVDSTCYVILNGVLIHQKEI